MKHVEFYSKNKSGKLVHLVGFIVGIQMSKTYRMLKFASGSFGLDSILLTEGNIVDPCYEIWE